MILFIYSVIFSSSMILSNVFLYVYMKKKIYFVCILTTVCLVEPPCVRSGRIVAIDNSVSDLSLSSFFFSSFFLLLSFFFLSSFFSFFLFFLLSASLCFSLLLSASLCFSLLLSASLCFSLLLSFSLLSSFFLLSFFLS